MSDQNESPNHILNCTNCRTVTVIPKDAPFTYEDDFCQTCGKSFFGAPEPEPHSYDPDGELKRLEVKVFANASSMVAYSNDSVKQFIEKRLLLAWTALKSADHLEDEAPADVLGRQDVIASPLDIIGTCVEEMWGLDRAIGTGKAVII